MKNNTSTLVLKADPSYDDSERLTKGLFDSGIDIFSENFKLEDLGRGFYIINIQGPFSFDSQAIFSEFGRIKDVTKCFSPILEETPENVEEFLLNEKYRRAFRDYLRYKEEMTREFEEGYNIEAA